MKGLIFFLNGSSGLFTIFVYLRIVYYDYWIFMIGTAKQYYDLGVNNPLLVKRIIGSITITNIVVSCRLF